MINIQFFGVPKGSETYPAIDKLGYFQQFDDRRNTDTWRLLIRQNKNIVRYIYIRYRLIGGDREGSLFGISVELENHYLSCVSSELIDFFHKFYNSILVDKKLLIEDNKKVSFIPDTFKSVSNYLDWKINQLKQIPELLKDDLIKLRGYVDYSG